VLYATGFMWFPNNAQGRARATTAGFEGNVGMKVCMVKVDTRNSGAKAHVGTLLLNPGRLWQFLGKFHTKFRKCYFSYNNKTHIAKRFRLLFAH